MQDYGQRTKTLLLQTYRQKAFERYKGTYRTIQERDGEKLLQTRYSAQLSVYAEALGIQERYLERFIQK